jgi:hypothetical protein
MSDHTPSSPSEGPGGAGAPGSVADGSHTGAGQQPIGQQQYAQQPYGGPPVQQSNGLAVTGLVLGIIGVLFGFIPFIGVFMAILLGVLAAIFGGVGLSRSKLPARGGRGMAIAGLVLGIIAIGLGFAQGFVIGEAANQLDQDLQEFEEQQG